MVKLVLRVVAEIVCGCSAVFVIIELVIVFITGLLLAPYCVRFLSSLTLLGLGDQSSHPHST
jgi:hypothetical protein